VSVKPKPVKVMAVGLFRVKVITLGLPTPTTAGLKALATVGFRMTFRFTGPEPAPAVGTWVVVTPLTVLGLLPSVLLVTCTVTVQPPGATFGTVRFKDVAPTTNAGELVTPTQPPPITVEASVMFTKLSVKLALVKMLVLPLPSAKVMVLMPPTLMLAGLNDLTMLGAVSGAGVMIKLAAAVALVLAFTEVTVLVVLVTPGLAASTLLVIFTLMLQLPVPPALNGTVAAVNAIEVSLAALPVPTVPPQVLVKLGVPNTFMPAGKISLNAAPVMAVVVDGLVRVMVKVVALLAMMLVGENAFSTTGAVKRTASGAVAAALFPPPLAVLNEPAVGEAAIVLV
jgi:hypothetical protein